MKNLLYKELKLTITPFFFVLPILTGALMLIPSWLYFFVLLYFCFITVPNLFAMSKADNDIGFSVMMPVRKSDVVKARFMSIMILELLHIILAVVYAIINNNIYNIPNFFMDPNVAFFGLIFIMYGIFNAILLPMFYKTGYKYGLPVIIGNIFAVLFAASIEVLVLLNPTVRTYLKGTTSSMVMVQVIILLVGILIFFGLAMLSYKRSVKNFEVIDV